MHRLSSVTDLKDWQQTLIDKQKQFEKNIVVSAGTCGQASGALDIVKAFEKELARRNLLKKIALRVTGCHGFCEQDPVAVVEPSEQFYRNIRPKDVPSIVDALVGNGTVDERLLFKDPESKRIYEKEPDVPFYKAQRRTLLEQNKRVDPRSLEDYVAIGGYFALAKALVDFSPEDVIEEVREAGLRGRGGGGFPTAKKWASCRQALGNPKYVICNADEGDPGAYMDRSLLEGNPHSIIEGMIIGAYAIGASQGFIYVRNEYPIAVAHTKQAVSQARKAGLLGDDILGSGFSFDIKIARGAGAFVCGESTALMASLEGKVGEPRAKDIHTVEQGYMGLPSALNNVETWANVPVIIRNGAKQFSSVGTEGSTGTKIFALTGHVRNTGLVEVPMGTTINQIVYEIGGGSSDGHPIKAVQTGGPSGGCLPVDKFNLPVDFDALYEAGAMMGSGGMVVMGRRTCMVDVAKYFLTFLLDESCGNCVPCRIGIRRMLEIVTDITEGNGSIEKIELLEETAETATAASLCGLGKTAANPVLSTLRYFRDEYEAHINENRCPAGVCRSLITYSIDENKCDGCLLCKNACPEEAISGSKREVHEIDPDKCNRCGICMDVCKKDAVVVA